MSDFDDFSNLDPSMFSDLPGFDPGAPSAPQAPQTPASTPGPTFVNQGAQASTAPPYQPGGDVWVNGDGTVAPPSAVMPQAYPQGPVAYTAQQGSAPVASSDTTSGSVNAAAAGLLLAALAGTAGFLRYGVGGAAAGVALTAGAVNIYKAPGAGDKSAYAQEERGRALLAAAADFALGGWVLYHLIKDHHGDAERR